MVASRKISNQGVWIVSPADQVLGGGDFEYRDAPKVMPPWTRP